MSRLNKTIQSSVTNGCAVVVFALVVGAAFGQAADDRDGPNSPDGPITVATTETEHAITLNGVDHRGLISSRLTVIGPDGNLAYREQGAWDAMIWTPTVDARDGWYTWETTFVVTADNPAAGKGAGRRSLTRSGRLYVRDGRIVSRSTAGSQTSEHAGIPKPERELGWKPADRDRAWPMRVLSAIGSFLVPSAHAQNFNVDVIVDESTPAYYFSDTDDGQSVGADWLIEADETPSILSIAPTNDVLIGQEIMRLHSDAPENSVALKSSGGFCVSSNGSCDTSSAGGTDLVIESSSPAIEWTDADDPESQKWGVFTDDDQWRVTDRTGGNNEAVVAEAGVIDNALYLTNERVGLGTATPSPDSKLHIMESAYPDIRLDNGTDFIELEWNGSSLGIDNSNNGNGARPFRIEVAGTPADSFVLDESGDVGIGIGSPAQPVHVSRPSGAQIFVENTSSVTDERIPFRLRNNGKVRFVLENMDAGETWTFDNSGASFDISRVGTGVPELQVQGNGDVRMDSGEAYAQAFNTVSSRTKKTDFEQVESDHILDKVSALDVTQWRYKADAEGDRHIGPTAEQFQALFGLGDGKHLNLVDTTGVTFAAIQGLREETRERIAELKAENEALRARVAEIDQIKAQVERLQDEAESN